MKILFIGGTGNLSTDCAALLQSRGHDVALLTRGRSPVPAMFRSIIADRKDAAAMRAACSGFAPEVVVNCLGFEPSDLAVDLEVFGRNIRQYIFISTAAAYVKPPTSLPITEAELLGNRFWDYAQKKQACEEMLRAHPELATTIVRPSHTYGPNWFPNLLVSASYTLPARLLAGKPLFLPDNDNLWTLTATSDFAVGLAGLVGNEPAVGEAFHITSDEALTWPEIYAQTAAALGAPPPNLLRIPLDWLCERFPQLTGPLRGDKANPAVFDNAKIKRFVPEFVCRKPFRAGIRESAAHTGIVNMEIDSLYDAVVAAWGSR
jgi:nucleoside-diphosphate-sugar epimerase